VECVAASPTDGFPVSHPHACHETVVNETRFGLLAARLSYFLSLPTCTHAPHRRPPPGLPCRGQQPCPRPLLLLLLLLLCEPFAPRPQRTESFSLDAHLELSSRPRPATSVVKRREPSVFGNPRFARHDLTATAFCSAPTLSISISPALPHHRQRLAPLLAPPRAPAQTLVPARYQTPPPALPQDGGAPQEACSHLGPGLQDLTYLTA